MIQEIFKGKGDPGIPAAYRDVLLANESSKKVGKHLRTHIYKSVSSFCTRTQFGAGLNKILEENSNLPSFLELVFTPDIYLPIIGLLILVIFGFVLRKKFIVN